MIQLITMATLGLALSSPTALNADAAPAPAQITCENHLVDLGTTHE